MSSQLTASEIHKTFQDLEEQDSAEHVSLESNPPTISSDAEVTSAVELKKISSTFEFANRLHGTHYRFELYEEGFLKIRSWKKKRLVQNHYLALRFLNPTPKISRVVAKSAFLTACGLGILSLLTAALSAFTSYGAMLGSGTILLACGAAIAFMLFLQRTYEKTIFYTSVGGCAVLTLMGTLESFRTCRTIIPAIGQAIEDAYAHNQQDRQLYLRQEMHEHYRLDRAGAISKGACGEATKTILGEFT
jgi:hypothetical protein